MNDRSLVLILAAVLSSTAAIAAPSAPIAAATAPAPAAPAATDATAPAAQLPPTPRHKPDPKDEAYSPNAPILASAPSSVAATNMLTASSAKAFPKWKPAMAVASGPFPRAKPEQQVALATPPSPAAPPPAAPVAPAAPATPPPPAMTTSPAAPATPAAADAGTCGDACNEVIFRSIGNCLWVQNANPHAVTFTARAGTRTITLALAGADAGKADAHKPFEPKEGTPSPIGEGAYHTRISDPFSPNSPGIAVYRARLGPADACVKAREEVTGYTASFTKSSALK